MYPQEGLKRGGDKGGCCTWARGCEGGPALVKGFFSSFSFKVKTEEERPSSTHTDVEYQVCSILFSDL